MALRFDDQTIVITGVCHGLGCSYAKYAASLGANVVVHDHFHRVGLLDLTLFPRAHEILVTG